jgi:hypothetical protein
MAAWVSWMAGEHVDGTVGSSMCTSVEESRVHCILSQLASMECWLTARSPPSAQKLQLAYHLTLNCEQL